MPRGGLSKDPEKRERQLAGLRAGQEIARVRREAGLPTKRRASRQSPAMTAGEGDSPVTGKVVPGSYAGKAGKATTAGDGNPAAANDDPAPHPDPIDAPEEPELGWIGRGYAKLLGYDVG